MKINWKRIDILMAMEFVRLFFETLNFKFYFCVVYRLYRIIYTCEEYDTTV